MDRITHQPPRQQGYGSTSSLRNDSLKHTRKHERRRKESNQRTKLSASGGLSGQAGRTVRKGRADSPTRCRGQSARDTRTVRPGATDRPLKTTEPPEPIREKRTVHKDRADRPLLKLGPSANPLQRKPKTKPDRKQRRARTRQTREEHAARGPSATASWTVRAARTEQKTARPRGSTLPIDHRISQMVEAIETRVWGHEKRQPRMLCPKISPPNFLNHQESRIL
jgi:hypothetical protein